jgi:hypothetical protein
MIQVNIVGGGIAGLHTGIEVVKRGYSCCIIDEYTCGGRVQTYHNKDLNLQWENGAGRISTAHKMVLSYIKKYNLTVIPLSSEIDYINQTIHKNPFFTMQHAFLEPLESLDPDVLATKTLKQIIGSIIPNTDFIKAFPYYAEISVLRADVALESFKGEIGSHDGFVICKEGLSALIDNMKKEFVSYGGIIAENMHVNSVESVNNMTYLHSIHRIQKTRHIFYAPIAILAIPSTALTKLIRIPAITNITKHLESVPLLRIYMVFDEPWFAGLNSTVVAGPIRYIIPISKRVIMISYTEGPYATKWKNMGENAAKTEILKEVRQLFPDRTIPEPVFFKMHWWSTGCTYWTPGKYDVEEASVSILCPKKGIFVCGESYAVEQSWMESALEHADLLWYHREFNAALKGLKGLKDPNKRP